MARSVRGRTCGGAAAVGLWFLLLAAPATVAPSQDANEMRSWKDASGKFEVRARLVERSGREVKLRTDKGREITVPIERLSKADRDHLDGRAAAADDPFAGGRPATPMPADAEMHGEKPGVVAAGTKMSAKTVLPGMGTTLSLKQPASDVPFVADPRPAPPEVPATAVSLGKVDFTAKLWGPFVTDAAAGRCLAVVGNQDGSAKNSAKVFAVDLKTAECREVWKETRPIRIWDHDPVTGITLVSESFDMLGRSGELSVYSGFDSGSPKKLYSRTLPGNQRSFLTPTFEWVGFAGPTLVAAVVENGLYVWDLAATKLVYRVDDVDEDAPPAFSGTAKQMAISQRSRVVVVETATGKVLRSVVTGGFGRAPVAFDDSGTRLAMSTGNQFLVWDLVKNEATQEATTTDELGRLPIRWVGPDMFLTGGGTLVHAGLQTAVWRYSFGHAAQTVAIGDKQLALCTTNKEAVIAAVDVPHGPVEGAIAALGELGDDDMVMRPGSPIRVSVEAPDKDDEARIAAWVGRSLKRTGWTVEDDAPVTLVARIGQEASRQIGIRDQTAGGRIVQVTLAPFFAELSIRRGKEVLWQRIQRNRLPWLTIYLEPGETVQQAVDRYTKPNAEFFAGLRFPPRLPAAEAAAIVGSSSLEQGHWK